MTGKLMAAYRGGDDQGRPGFSFKFRFNLEVIEALKTEVAPACRSYNEITHEWWVADDPAAIAAVERLFPSFRTFVDSPTLPGLEV